MSSSEKTQSAEIREMEVYDIPDVYQLGNVLFHGRQFTTLYRTWDAYEVTTNFNQDPELCLVAEADDERIVGFALGTTYEKEQGAWKYGQIIWLGVDPAYQGSHVGSMLYQDMERRMRLQGVRMLLVDTASSNTMALRFFKGMGFGKPRYQVWMSKVIRQTRSKRQ